jgi:hypothetical protein
MYMLPFSTVKEMYLQILTKKMNWAKLWVFFSQTHPVTLDGDDAK